MKFIIPLLAVITSALAQSIAITAPPPLTKVAPGQKFTVTIARPNSLTGSQDVAVAIGLTECAMFPGGKCDSIPVEGRFGPVLFTGLYHPTQHPLPAPSNINFYQNFTVKVPTTFRRGEASLNVAHFTLIGAGPFPNLDVSNITINVT